MGKGESENKRETVGKVSSDLLLQQTSEISPIDLTSELLTDYEKNIEECINNLKANDPTGDYYVVVITKKEPLMHNVLRNYFMGRRTCPTPDYDQTVYKWDGKRNQISFVWTIPSRDTCILLLQNKSKVAREEHGLLDFVIKFYEGTLFELAKKLNGEVSLESPILSS